MAGRKRKPTKLHIVHGTAIPSRLNKNEPIAPSEPPRPGIDLAPRASFWFGVLVGRLQSMGVGSVADSEQVMLCATRLAEIEECDADIKEYGRVTVKFELIEVPNPDPQKTAPLVKVQKILKSNPAVAQRSEAMRHAQSLLAEFGLSPASRMKVSANIAKAEDENRWTSLV